MNKNLGRGLEAIFERNPQNQQQNSAINSDVERSESGSINKINVDKIKPNPFQPRTVFDAQALEELRNSILQNGLIQPITVRMIDGGMYELISGERRLKACKELGYKQIPAYIIVVKTDEEMLALALIENLQREKLNPIEVGLAYKKLIEECNLTQDEVAAKIGKDRTTVANMIRLLRLPDEIQESLAKEELTIGHARSLLSLPDTRAQLDALHKIKAEGLSVRKVEQLVKKYLTEKESSRKTKNQTNDQRNSGSSVREVEDRLRRIFATKVACKQKSGGAGEIVIEYYSLDDLDRLFELFDVIEKSNI